MPDCICANENKENLLFDQTVGALQEILIDPDFTKMQNEFLDKNCDEFEDNKENKLSYTKIFKEYVELVESVLDKQLNDRVNGYSQEKFMEQLKYKNFSKIKKTMLNDHLLATKGTPRGSYRRRLRHVGNYG
uniref:ADP-ribosylation factor-like protein 2-binding protein n=1 Tax=Lotharella globosa TaxID=91324 RepID=A0A7S3YMM0_9EUKA